MVEQESLVRQASQGDQAAFGALVEQTQHAVYRVALRVLQSPADAEEATQEAFLRAWQQLHRFQFKSSITTWICRIAVHVAIDLLRKRKRQPTDSLQQDQNLQGWLEQLPTQTLSPEGALEWAQLQQKIEDILASMKPEFRLVFALREIDGLSYEEIAQIIDVPVGTVESRLHRARQMFWKQYNRVHTGG